MRVLLLSDTHGQHRRLGTLPEADVLIHGGDILSTGWDTPLLADFDRWLGEQPIPTRIVIAGNHDRVFEGQPTYARSHLTNALYLENSGVEIGGLKFWGSPVTPWFYDWAFNMPRGPAIRRYWDMIPPDTDVLITHGPPISVLDRMEGTSEHLGCADLYARVMAFPPRLHVFGHIHSGHGVEQRGRTTFVNAAVLNEQYRIAYPPILIDIDPKETP